MKKILILMIGLLLAMPIFGQKLNSRGEKMVKSIIDVSSHKHESMTYSFNYDMDGNMVSAKVVKDQNEGNPKFWLIEKEGNILTLTTNQKCFSSNIFYANPVIHKLTLDTNSDGLIKKVIVPRFDNFDDPDSWKHIDYTYGKTENGCYVLMADTISYWIHEEGKKPILIKNENPTYQGRLYSYNSGKYQYKDYSYYQGETYMLGYPYYLYDDIKNETNIPFAGLFRNIDMLEKFLHLTDWNPIYNPILPYSLAVGNDNINEYKYYYENGNIVRIEVYDVQSDTGNLLLTNDYIIEYVEE